ncbi:MAG: anhydro-N-acetylmuramic acid kinase [Anaerolineae bacterium]|nr:anhydro-N-acetylmuramic acid kinase [Anaerolineae bacterium]
MIVLGIISGTSVDRIEGAIVRFEERADSPGTLFAAILAHDSHPIPNRLREACLSMLPPGRGSVRAVCEVNFAVGEVFAEAANTISNRASIRPDLIASHGQTIYHLVEGKRALATLQIGHPSIIAERTGITTIADFRPRDIAAGGQGAPLVNLLDVLLLSGTDTPRAAQNLGGIANMTIVAPDVEPFAFDSGPANSLLDYAAAKLSGGKLTYDKDGAWAARGKVNEALLAEMMAHPYLKLQPPKSTGKEHFGPAFVEPILARGLDSADCMATLTAFTAHSIAQAYHDFAPYVREVFVSGGGAHNRTLMAMIETATPDITWRRIDELGLPSDSKEAIAFALLGYQTLHGRPGTVPTCTGASHATVLGHITPGDNYRSLLHTIAEGETSVKRLQVVS